MQFPVCARPGRSKMPSSPRADHCLLVHGRGNPARVQAYRVDLLAITEPRDAWAAVNDAHVCEALIESDALGERADGKRDMGKTDI